MRFRPPQKRLSQALEQRMHHHQDEDSWRQRTCKRCLVSKNKTIRSKFDAKVKSFALGCMRVVIGQLSVMDQPKAALPFFLSSSSFHSTLTFANFSVTHLLSRLCHQRYNPLFTSIFHLLSRFSILIADPTRFFPFFSDFAFVHLPTHKDSHCFLQA